MSIIVTSIKETSTAAIIPKECPASNVGAPHCSGYGIFILKMVDGTNFSLVIKKADNDGLNYC